MASEQVFQYDVFLNHRGPDTKEQFLVPLIEKLHEAGIEGPFLDQQGIQTGEPVFEVINKALNSARMHIAVFSRSYAQSQYCLSELQEMLRTGRHIIPVFYDVQPEHVRRPKNPSGPFEEGFRKHLEREKPQVVEDWVAAMEKAAERKGFVRHSLKYRGNDELLMKDIIDDVVKLLSPTTVTIQSRLGRYDWISSYKLPTRGQGIIFFAADTNRNLHIAFSPAVGMVFPSYEIVIGLQDSLQYTRSEIRRYTPEKTVCSYSPMDLTNTLQERNWHHFWICVDAVTQLIYVGQGQDLEEKHAFIIFKDPSFLENIQYIALSSNQVAITYAGIRMERTRPTLFGSFGQDSSAGLWSSIDASQVLPPSQDVNFLESAHIYGDYNWLKAYKLPTKGRGIVSFSAKAITDVRVAISPKPQTMDSMYEMVIGGWGNNASSIQKKEILCHVTTIGWIQRGQENEFWMSINVDTQLIHVGQGNRPNLDSVFCIYKDPYFVSEARYVSFFSLDANVVYSNIFVASPSATRLLSTQPLELSGCMGNYNWDSSFKFLSEGQGILYFAAKARNDVHVAISPKCDTTNPMYEIVIGGWQNTRSCIQRCSQGFFFSDVGEGFIDMEGLNHYWVSIDKDTKLIQVGRGHQANPNSVLFMYMDPCFLHDAMYIAFSTWDTPITYSSIAVSFQNATITKPLQSVQELSQEQVRRANFQLQDPYYKVVISQNCLGHYQWQDYFELPSKGQGVVTFATKTITDIHMAISLEPETVNPMYEIVIGGWKNSKSVIRRAAKGDDVCSRCSSPIASGLNHYWVSVDASTRFIKVGHGRNPKIESSIFLSYRDSNFISDARYVTFTNFNAPITYSLVAVSFQSATITKPLQSTQELSQKQTQRANFQLQDPHFQVVISQNCLGHYQWQDYFELPSKGQGVVTFATKTITDIHMAISPEPETVNPMYEIVIGGWKNSKSVIRRAAKGNDVCSRCSSPIASGLNHYWVSVDASTRFIKVGHGRNPKIESSIFLSYRDSNFISDARYVTFTNFNAPITYSLVAVSFQSATITKPLQSTQELSQKQTQRANFQLQDPHFQVVISQNCLGHYQWQDYFELPSRGQGVVTFVAKTITDVHVAISPEPETVNPMYEIVIGGWKNSKSVIRRASKGDDVCSRCSSPIASGLNHYWVSVDASTRFIKVGHGRNPEIESSIFLSYRDSNFISDARYVTFTNFNAPITYSLVAVSFQSATITKPLQSTQELSQKQTQRANFQLQDPHFQVVISQNCLGHYQWQDYFELPSRGQGVVTFAAKTITDIHMAISPEPETVNPMYEIVIGGWDNSKSVIRRASKGDDVCSRCSSPIASGLNHYWVSIDASTQLIKVGCGRNPEIESSIFLQYMDLNFISGARYVTFTNWEAPATYSNISLGTIQSFANPIRKMILALLRLCDA